MRRRPPRSTRTDTLLPNTTLVLSRGAARRLDRRRGGAPRLRRLGRRADGRGGPRHVPGQARRQGTDRSEEHTSELQSLMRISYAVFCLKKKTYNKKKRTNIDYKVYNTLHLYETTRPHTKRTP